MLEGEIDLTLIECKALYEKENYKELLWLALNKDIDAPANNEYLVYVFRALNALKMSKVIIPTYLKQKEKINTQISGENKTEITQIFKSACEGLTGMEQDMITVREFLKEGCKHNDNEALFCNIEVFKYIYNLSQKTSIKSGNKLSVLLLTMAQKVANNPPQKDVSNCMNNIKNILVKKLLHKSDTLAMYSSNQFLLMLSGSSAAKIQSICHNITAALLPVLEEEGLQLRVNIMQE